MGMEAMKKGLVRRTGDGEGVKQAMKRNFFEVIIKDDSKMVFDVLNGKDTCLSYMHMLLEDI